MANIIVVIPKYRENTAFKKSLERVLDKYDAEYLLVPKNANHIQQQQFLYAIHVAEIVIVDCTIPEDGTDGGVYPALTAQINILNHIIVISENNLPLNITPYRGIYPRKDGEAFSVDHIMRKLPTIIEVSLKQDTYPRLPEDMYKDFMKYQVEMEQMMGASLEARKKHQTKKTPVMISYRNSHATEVDAFKKIVLGTDSMSVAKRKEMGCEGNYEIKVLPPASLCGADEAHTPMRRWMLVGLLEDHIREVDEVWVFESRTKNKETGISEIDYTNSWWTIAEMVMVANLNFNNTKQIKVRVFNPETYKFYDVTPEKYLAKITEDQHKRLARYLSNTRPDTMGPECLEQVSQLKKIAILMRLSTKEMKQQLLENLRANFEQSVPKTLPEEDRQKMIDDMIDMYSDPKKIEAYANDDVFKADFWEKISYQLSSQTDCFHDDQIDVDKFMSIPMDEKTSLTPKDIAKTANTKDGTINLGSFMHPAKRKISKATTDRYLWLATRMGQPTVKEGNAPGLERIPIYNIEDID